MTIAAQARVVGAGVLLSWTDSATQSYVVTVTEYDLTDPDNPSTRSETITSPDILSWYDDELDVATQQVTYLVTGTDAQTSSVTVVLDGTLAYGTVDPLETTIRYTTLALVKSQLGILSTNTDRDTEITQAIISAETWIDDYLGRSFPDPTGGKIVGIPERVKRAALLLSVGFYTEAGASDVDPFSVELRRQQASDMAVGLLYGYRVAWGIA